MIQFHIEAPDKGLEAALQDKIDNLTKPKGSLGTLEALALQVGLIQQTLSPVLRHPVNVIYASDHGIADEGVSKSPKEVTRQVIHNFLNGGAGVCYLARQHGFELKIVDGGVDFDFPVIPQLIDRKVRKGGTRNFLHEAAMTVEEMEKALQYGADIVTDCYNEGCNVISFGEMGIGNTAASSMWMTCLTQIPLIDCVGAGSGLDSEGVRHKYNVLKRSLENYKGDGSALDVMRYFGGYEMVMAVGGMLRAAELKMIILVDGFIMTNCVLVASRLYPEMQSYCVFGHCGDEAGHKRILDFLGAKALLAPYTPYDTDKSSLVTAWNAQGRPYYDYSKYNTGRLPAFGQIDVRVDKTFYLKRCMLGFYIDLQNVTKSTFKQPDIYMSTGVIENPSAPITEQRYKMKYIEQKSGTLMPTLGITFEY